MSNHDEIVRLQREIAAAEKAEPRDEAKLKTLRDQLAAEQRKPDPKAPR